MGAGSVLEWSIGSVVISRVKLIIRMEVLNHSPRWWFGGSYMEPPEGAGFHRLALTHHQDII